MSIYQDWKQDVEAHSQSAEQQNEYWNGFCDAEKGVYQKILTEKNNVLEGSFQELAERYDMKPIWFMGFMDGISESVNEPLPELETVEAETPVKIDIDFEKLYTNMLKVPAEWLYTLEEWDNIFPEEKRAEITKAYKKSKTVVKGQKIGRNDPCPCGSGKKYKKCCGKNL